MVIEREPEIVEWCRKDEENLQTLLEAAAEVQGGGAASSRALAGGPFALMLGPLKSHVRRYCSDSPSRPGCCRMGFGQRIPRTIRVPMEKEVCQ